MLEVLARFLAVVFAGLMMVVFSVYFLFFTDSLRHDWVYAGGAAAVLGGGLTTLALAPLVLRQVKEYGTEGIASDVLEANVIESPAPAGRGGAAAAAAATSDEEE